MNPKDKEAVQRVVIAGQKLMYDEKTFPTFKQGMEKDMPMADKLVTETVGLMKLLQDRANGGIPRQVLTPAAALLLLEIAKFMEDADIAKPSKAEVKEAVTKLPAMMARVFPKGPESAPAQPAVPASAPPAPAAPAGILNQGV